VTLTIAKRQRGSDRWRNTEAAAGRWSTCELVLPCAKNSTEGRNATGMDGGFRRGDLDKPKWPCDCRRRASTEDDFCEFGELGEGRNRREKGLGSIPVLLAR
jgi:hypothetical protein